MIVVNYKRIIWKLEFIMNLHLTLKQFDHLDMQRYTISCAWLEWERELDSQKLLCSVLTATFVIIFMTDI